MKPTLAEYLSSFLTPRRLELMQKVLSHRLKNLAVILEDIYDPHNANAVLRTAEGLGIQRIFVIENRNLFNFSPGVSFGAPKWLTIKRFNSAEQDNTEICIKEVKNLGYTIYASSVHDKSMLLDDLPYEKPLALLFGSEKWGVSEKALSLCDGTFHIPMYGFTESFNISVSAAIALYTLAQKIRKSNQNFYFLPEEKQEIYLSWLRKNVKNAEQLEKKFKEKYQS